MDNGFNFSKLHGPEECARALWQKVPGYIRLTFCAGVASGLVAHLYMLTNKFTNHDDVFSLFGNGYGVASGRWLLPLAEYLSGRFSMPWLVGLLSILCLAGVACLTVSLLRIRKPLGCIITAAILVSYPASLATLTYMFSAFAYFLSFLLAAAGAWMAVKRRWLGSALGAAFIALSLSIYQSYLPAAAALMVGALLFETLDGEKSFKELVLDGVRLLGTLIAALILYVISVRISTRGLGLISYMGLDEMGKISLKELPRLIVTAYQNFIPFFWKDVFDFHFGFLKYAFVLTALGTAALLGLLLRRRQLGLARTALATALFSIYPLAANLIYIMVPHAYAHTLMIYGMAYILFLPIALAEYTGPALREGLDRSFHVAVNWIVVLTMALTAYSYTVTDNKTYLRIDIGMRQCEAYSNRLLERIESCEGYVEGMNVILVGSQDMQEELSPFPELEPIHIMGALDLAWLRGSYSYNYFLKNFLGFISPVYVGGSEEALEAAAWSEVQEMPFYPYAGSIRVIRGVLVVRMH